MIIQFGERLRALRKNRNMTQDELAGCLGVSYQAVSRWERDEGYPDISTLPILAEFFDVSIDDLLGVNQEKSRRKIQEYILRGAEYFNKQDYMSCITVLRRALCEFPNSSELMYALMQGLFSDYENAASSGNERESCDEIILLGNRILASSRDDKIRAKARDMLCNFYIYKINDKKRAKEIADTIPDFDYFRAFISALCVNDRNERQKAYQQMIMNHIHVVAGSIRSYIGDCNTLTDEDAVKLIRRCNAMYSVLFDDEYDNDILISNNYALAKCYMNLKDHKNAISSLEQCVGFAEHYDRIKGLPKTEAYKTPLLNKLPIVIDALTAFEKYETRDINICEILLSQLESENDIFAPLRDTEEYRDLISRLKSGKQKI